MRPFQLVTGRAWKGTAFGGARGPHRRAEDRRLVHAGQARYRSDDHLRDAACQINKAFELMKRGESIRGVLTF